MYVIAQPGHSGDITAVHMGFDSDTSYTENESYSVPNTIWPAP